MIFGPFATWPEIPKVLQVPASNKGQDGYAFGDFGLLEAEANQTKTIFSGHPVAIPPTIGHP